MEFAAFVPRSVNELPPTMLCKAQWEAAAEIGGALNIKELGLQYELAVKVLPSPSACFQPHPVVCLSRLRCLVHAGFSTPALSSPQGEFVALELDWRRKMASNAEIRKRLGKAAMVQKMALEQEEKAKSPVRAQIVLESVRSSPTCP